MESELELVNKPSKNAQSLEKEEVVTIVTTSQKNLWDEIVEKSERDKREVEKYIKDKNADSEVYPEPLASLNTVVFPLLEEGMVEMLHKIKEDDSFYRRKTTLNGLDYLSEYLYNMNPNYPGRQSNWTYIFDMDWVKKFLKEHPRPYFPFHLVWSRDFAALKIQSYMRGYWARIRPDVLEVRMFWKALKEDKEGSKLSIIDEGPQSSSKPIILPPISIPHFR